MVVNANLQYVVSCFLFFCEQKFEQSQEKNTLTISSYLFSKQDALCVNHRIFGHIREDHYNQTAAIHGKGLNESSVWCIKQNRETDESRNHNYWR
jgi:hypothetical protein